MTYESVQIVAGIVFFGTVLLSLLGVFDVDGVDTDLPDFETPDLDVPDLDSGELPDGDAEAESGGGWSLWSLLSLRPLSAGLFVGATMAVWSRSISPWLAGSLFVVSGVLMAAATAWAVRRLTQLEEDNTVSVSEALYERCVVTAAVKPGFRGAVELNLRGQTVELPAVADRPFAQGDTATVAKLTDGVATLEA